MTDDKMFTEDEVQRIVEDDDTEFATVRYESPQTDVGYAIAEGWTLTGTFLNTDVPLITVISPIEDGQKKIPLDRVLDVEVKLPPGRDR